MLSRIAVIAPPWYPTPPDGYGGVELIVGLLVKALRERGHEAVLFGADGSTLADHTLADEKLAEDLGQDGERRRELIYAARVARTLRADGEFDIVHEHCGWSTLLATGLVSAAPVVHTVHGSIPEIDVDYYRELPDSIGLVAISESQRESAADLRWVGTVHNAVDIDSLQVGARPDPDAYFVCLARICEDKGQHLAIEVARRAGMKLILAGKPEPSEAGQEYFRRRVEPAIDGDRVVHVENVAGKEKARLLAGATALLAPIQWAEPFGLFMVEAMASGAPVIALRDGAVPELVIEGETGFIVDDVDGMVEAIGHLDSIDRQHCAEIIREQYSPAAMADGYIAVYEKVIAAHS